MLVFEAIQTYHYITLKMVSILVLVDVGLRGYSPGMFCDKLLGVSILVLVDVGLRAVVICLSAIGVFVSILVLVDVGLRG